MINIAFVGHKSRFIRSRGEGMEGKKWMRMKVWEGERGRKVSYWGVAMIAMGSLLLGLGANFGTTCWPNETKHIITTSSSFLASQS